MQWNGNAVQHLYNGDGELNMMDNDGNTPIGWAAEYGHKDVVELLIELKSDVNKSGSDRYTPLMVAANRGHLDVVKVLLEHGADKELVNKYGRKAVDLAKTDEMKT